MVAFQESVAPISDQQDFEHSFKVLLNNVMLDNPLRILKDGRDFRASHIRRTITETPTFQYEQQLRNSKMLKCIASFAISIPSRTEMIRYSSQKYSGKNDSTIVVVSESFARTICYKNVYRRVVLQDALHHTQALSTLSVKLHTSSYGQATR